MDVGATGVAEGGVVELRAGALESVEDVVDATIEDVADMGV